MLCVVRSMMDVSTSNYHSVGVIVVGIDISSIDSLLSSVQTLPTNKYAVLFENEPMLGNAELSGQDMEHLLAQAVSETEIIYESTGGRSYMYSVCTSGRCTVILQTDIEELKSMAYHLDPIFYIMLAGLAATSLATIFFILKGIILPIRIMIRLCQEFEGEPMDISHSHLMPQELDSLFLEFQNMSERITTLIHQVLIRDIRQKDSELQLLRTQINPHFIYNTLQIIQSKAYIRKAVDVAVMSELLGENLRYGLREPNREVPLSAEVSSVSKYLELMSYHYGDKLDYHLHFAESILSLPTIKLLFAANRGKLAGPRSGAGHYPYHCGHFRLPGRRRYCALRYR